MADLMIQQAADGAQPLNPNPAPNLIDRMPVEILTEIICYALAGPLEADHDDRIRSILHVSRRWRSIAQNSREFRSHLPVPRPGADREETEEWLRRTYPYPIRIHAPAYVERDTLESDDYAHHPILGPLEVAVRKANLLRVREIHIEGSRDDEAYRLSLRPIPIVVVLKHLVNLGDDVCLPLEILRIRSDEIGPRSPDDLDSVRFPDLMESDWPFFPYLRLVDVKGGQLFPDLTLFTSPVLTTVSLEQVTDPEEFGLWFTWESLRNELGAFSNSVEVLKLDTNILRAGAEDMDEVTPVLHNLQVEVGASSNAVEVLTLESHGIVPDDVDMDEITPVLPGLQVGPGAVTNAADVLTPILPGDEDSNEFPTVLPNLRYLRVSETPVAAAKLLRNVVFPRTADLHFSFTLDRADLPRYKTYTLPADYWKGDAPFQDLTIYSSEPNQVSWFAVPPKEAVQAGSLQLDVQCGSEDESLFPEHHEFLLSFSAKLLVAVRRLRISTPHFPSRALWQDILVHAPQVQELVITSEAALAGWIKAMSGHSGIPLVPWKVVIKDTTFHGIAPFVDLALFLCGGVSLGCKRVSFVDCKFEGMMKETWQTIIDMIGCVSAGTVRASAGHGPAGGETFDDIAVIFRVAW
ncbi:hypothetical protein FA95DRAFT_1603323 [Auriscalpium vulgare]|uniref:Uncharacterized protein n=1 Tax=Auriscalpium vulgare TaxID=40419 RepID=A0ACB8S2K9_9AGAM|nr:hypothetical protein FA95DRAFT_1603323 [Auriscalpium vulgare]